MRLHRTTTCIAALCLSAAPVLADITPEQLWDEISTIYDGTYQEFSHDEPRREGDTLVIENVKMAFDDAEAEFAISLDDIRLRAVAADSVEITVSETITIDIAPPPGGEDISVDLTHSNLIVLAQGAPGDLDYTYNADEVRASMSFADDAESGTIGMVLSDFAGLVATEQSGELLDYQGRYTAGEMRFSADVNSAEDGKFVVQGTTKDLTMALEGAMPNVLFEANPDIPFEEAMAAGLRITGNITQGGLQLDFEGTNADTGALSGNGSIESSKTSFAMSADGVSYDGEVNAVEIDMTGDALPAPVNVTLGSYGVGLAIPAKVGEPFQPMRLAFFLRDLSASDALWNLFDPNERMTRDPITVDMALSSVVTPLASVFSEDAMEDADVPFRFQTATIDRLLVRALGAELTGEGAFSFGEESEAFDGFQAITGSAKATLTGLNSALDQLDRAGLIPADALMGPRMMIGMIAVPSGDDQLTSELEVREDGQVLVNGNRMR